MTRSASPRVTPLHRWPDSGEPNETDSWESRRRVYRTIERNAGSLCNRPFSALRRENSDQGWLGLLQM